MGKLEAWDFTDIAKNSTTQLINRQKSALNVEIRNIDASNRSGIFFDLNNGTVQTSLDECECFDFNYIGSSPRKKFQPCKHIYRLAIELGFLEARHIASKSRLSSLSPEERRKEEVDKLRSLPKDGEQWGSWNAKIHKHWSQKERQSRAYEIQHDKENVVDKKRARGIISLYQTDLSSCSCADFEERKLPCKHIYCLAHLLRIVLTISREDSIEENEFIRKNLRPIVSVGYKDGDFFVKDHRPKEGDKQS